MLSAVNERALLFSMLSSCIELEYLCEIVIHPLLVIMYNNLAYIEIPSTNLHCRLSSSLEVDGDGVLLFPILVCVYPRHDLDSISLAKLFVHHHNLTTYYYDAML